MLLFPPYRGPRSRRHVVLHDLNAVLILKGNAGNLIKCYTVPQADKSNGLSGHVVEQIGDGGLSARNKDAVGGDLLV